LTEAVERDEFVDAEDAMDKAGKAKLFSFIGIGVGLIFGIIYALLMVLGVVGAAAAGAASP
jgi:predicted membrane metal-binding protein